MSSGITFYYLKTQSFSAAEGGLWCPSAGLGKGILRQSYL